MDACTFLFQRILLVYAETLMHRQMVWGNYKYESDLRMSQIDIVVG